MAWFFSFKSWFNRFQNHPHDGSMVLVYMLTWLGYIDGIHVTIYGIHGSYGVCKKHTDLHDRHVENSTHVFKDIQSKMDLDPRI
jgi:hypothetical protein